LNKILTLLAIQFCCVFHVNAGYVTQNNVKIERVNVGYTGGEIYFSIDRTPSNPKSCSNTGSSNRLIAVDPNRSSTAQVLSALLSVQARGSLVELHIYDDSCFNNFAKLRRLSLL